jgi:Creatinine amidohydrolase
MLEEIEWARMTRIELREFAARPRALVLLPVGALEQHGPHLPTITDTASAYAAAVRAVRLVSAETPVPRESAEGRDSTAFIRFRRSRRWRAAPGTHGAPLRKRARNSWQSRPGPSRKAFSMRACGRHLNLCGRTHPNWDAIRDDRYQDERVQILRPDLARRSLRILVRRNPNPEIGEFWQMALRWMPNCTTGSMP